MGQKENVKIFSVPFTIIITFHQSLMRKFLVIFLLIILNSISLGYTIHTEADDYLAQPVNSFQVKNSTLYDAIKKLCKEQKIRICMEDKRNYSAITNEAIAEKHITTQFKSTNVMIILNNICKMDSTYFWEYSRDGLLNVLPRSTTLGTYDNSTLNWVMSGFKIMTSSVQFICSPDFPYGISLKQYGMNIDWEKSTTSTNIATRLLTINLPPATGRDGLNSIVKSSGRNYLWHLYWKNQKPIIEFQQAFPYP